MSPRQPPTATPHLFVRLSRKSDMSVGDQSTSQLAGRGPRRFQLLCRRRQVTPVALPRQLMFPERLLKWNDRAGASRRSSESLRDEYRSDAEDENESGAARRHREPRLPWPPDLLAARATKLCKRRRGIRRRVGRLTPCCSNAWSGRRAGLRRLFLVLVVVALLFSAAARQPAPTAEPAHGPLGGVVRSSAALAAPVAFERRVVVGADDAEEFATGSMYLTSSDLELVYDGSNQRVGIRFTNVTIPKGATITKAYLQFEAKETQSEATSLAIRGKAADNAAPFTSTNGNISTRARTGSSISWTPPAWTLIGEAGANQRSPDLSPAIQEILNRNNWASGNALALIITGTGHRTAWAYDGKTASAPLLHIEYTTAPPQSPANTSPPTISGVAREAQTLHADVGTWSGTLPIAYAYQWRQCDPSGGACTDVGTGAPDYTLTASDIGHTMRVVVTATNSVAWSTATSSQTTLVDFASVDDPVITAAGDICASSTDCTPTSDLVLSINPTRVLTLGDNAYDSGTADEYSSEYDPNWGRFKAKTSPTTGNHEYHVAGAPGYFSYFGSLVPAPYYSYDLGSWHLIALASSSAVDPGAGGAEETWLKQDLAAHPNTCVLAYWHEPRWSSGTTHGSNSFWGAVWDDLYAAHADVVLNGHEHNYERFAPQSPSGAVDPNGIREIIAGTGGASHGSPFGPPIANSEVRDDSTWGVLKMTLYPTSYAWQFVPIAGSTFTDSGSAGCH